MSLSKAFLLFKINFFTASDFDEDTEVVLVPLEAQQEKEGVETFGDAVTSTDTEHPYFSLAPYNPFKWNFGFFDDFQSEYLLFSNRSTQYENDTNCIYQ